MACKDCGKYKFALERIASMRYLAGRDTVYTKMEIDMNVIASEALGIPNICDEYKKDKE